MQQASGTHILDPAMPTQGASKIISQANRVAIQRQLIRTKSNANRDHERPLVNIANMAKALHIPKQEEKKKNIAPEASHVDTELINT